MKWRTIGYCNMSDQRKLVGQVDTSGMDKIDRHKKGSKLSKLEQIDDDEIILVQSTKQTKGKRKVPFDEALLCSEAGMESIYNSFPMKCKFRGRGHETADLKNLMLNYKEWAFWLHPGLAFSDVLDKCELLGKSKLVRDKMQALRERERDRYNSIAHQHLCDEERVVDIVEGTASHKNKCTSDSLTVNEKLFVRPVSKFALSSSFHSYF